MGAVHVMTSPPLPPIWRVTARLVTHAPGLYAFSLLMQVLRLSAIVVPGLVVQALFNQLTAHASLSLDVWALVALLVAVTLGRVAVVVGAVATELTVNPLAGTALRHNTFERLLRRDNVAALPAAIGDVVSRLRDDALQVMQCLGATVLVAGMGAGAAVALLLMWRIEPLLTVCVALPLALSGAIVQVASTRFQRYRQASRAAAGEFSALLAEALGAVQAVQTASGEARVVLRLGRLAGARRRAALAERLFHEVVLTSFMDTMHHLGAGIILLLAGQAMRRGTFTVGDYALFVYLLPRITDFTFYGGHLLAIWRQSRVALARLVPLVGDVPSGTLTVPPPAYVCGRLGDTRPDQPPRRRLVTLEAHCLTYRHPGTRRGAECVNLRLERGTLTVVVGPIGAGKTTLLRALLGLVPATGDVLWNGQVVADRAAFFTPPQCAYVPQVPVLFSETLRDNVLHGSPATDEALHTALWLAALDKDVEQLERGLDTLVGPRGVRLSGGQVQRTAAARALIYRPELLVVDDLSSALDVEIEHTLWNRLLERREMTILAVSNRRLTIERADHVITLQAGGMPGVVTDLCASR